MYGKPLVPWILLHCNQVPGFKDVSDTSLVDIVMTELCLVLAVH